MDGDQEETRKNIEEVVENIREKYDGLESIDLGKIEETPIESLQDRDYSDLAEDLGLDGDWAGHAVDAADADILTGFYDTSVEPYNFDSEPTVVKHRYVQDGMMTQERAEDAVAAIGALDNDDLHPNVNVRAVEPEDEESQEDYMGATETAEYMGGQVEAPFEVEVETPLLESHVAKSTMSDAGYQLVESETR